MIMDAGQHRIETLTKNENDNNKKNYNYNRISTESRERVLNSVFTQKPRQSS